MKKRSAFLFYSALALSSYTYISHSLAQEVTTVESAASESPNLKEGGTSATGESADITLVKKNKKVDQVVAKVSLEDRADGLSVVFNSESLEKGKYLIKLEESCAKAKGTKGEEIKLGTFTTTSGFISSEFIKKDLSVGDRFQSVVNKAISLHKIPKSGATTRVACAIIGNDS